MQHKWQHLSVLETMGWDNSFFPFNFSVGQHFNLIIYIYLYPSHPCYHWLFGPQIPLRDFPPKSIPKHQSKNSKRRFADDIFTMHNFLIWKLSYDHHIQTIMHQLALRISRKYSSSPSCFTWYLQIHNNFNGFSPLPSMPISTSDWIYK